MSDYEYDTKLMELERLLNDPDSKMEPARVWSLLAEISAHAPDAGDLRHLPVAGA